MSETPSVVQPFVLDQRKIQDYLPHRYPFLLVDRVLEISGPPDLDNDDPKTKMGVKVTAVKNISVNEPHFQGHFPLVPVMPGVLILETMAQVSSFSLYPQVMRKRVHQPDFKFQTVLVGVDEARFRVPVVPGDQLIIVSEMTGCRKTLCTYFCKAFVQDKLVAEAKILANLIPDHEKKVF